MWCSNSNQMIPSVLRLYKKVFKNVIGYRDIPKSLLDVEQWHVSVSQMVETQQSPNLKIWIKHNYHQNFDLGKAHISLDLVCLTFYKIFVVNEFLRNSFIFASWKFKGDIANIQAGIRGGFFLLRKFIKIGMCRALVLKVNKGVARAIGHSLNPSFNKGTAAWSPNKKGRAGKCELDAILIRISISSSDCSCLKRLFKNFKQRLNFLIYMAQRHRWMSNLSREISVWWSQKLRNISNCNFGIRTDVDNVNIRNFWWNMALCLNPIVRFSCQRHARKQISKKTGGWYIKDTH